MLKIVLLSLLLTLIKGSYSENTAVRQAELAVITHCSKAQIESWTCRPCKSYPYLTHVSQIQNTATHISGYVGYDTHRNSIVIAWRGTVDTRNWLEDLDFKQIDYNDQQCSKCKVHKGFYNAYVSVSGLLKDKIKSLLGLYPQATLDITGHSLGGALAYLTGLALAKNYPGKIKEMYVFGCPRVGNGNLAKYFHGLIAQLYRVIHYKDIVPHVPPKDFQFFHSPYEVFYDQAMKTYKVCSEIGEDPKCSDSLAPDYSFNDHTLYWLKTDSSVC